MRRAKILTLALLLVCVAGLGLQAYTQTSDEQLITPLGLPADTESLVLIFHGSEDADDPVLEDIAALFRHGTGANSVVVNYNWSPASDNRLRAQANARKLGGALAVELAQLANLRQLEMVAHSAGAYIPDALCEGLRWQLKTPPDIRTIYLDPFGLKGLFAWKDGANWHGHCADFALAIINTDDPAPATNEALALAYNIDITGHPGSAQIARNGHYWPLHYFAERLRSGALSFESMSHEALPRGALVHDKGTPGSLSAPLRD